MYGVWCKKVSVQHIRDTILTGSTGCRDKVLRFLLRMKQPEGGFAMHEGGEIDVRGCYTAISVSSTTWFISSFDSHCYK